MRQNDAVVLGGPGQNVPIVGSAQIQILDADDVQSRLAQQQSAHDLAIEVFVGQQPQHGLGLTLSTSLQPCTDRTDVALLTLDTQPNVFSLTLASDQILLDLPLMAQIVCDHRVHVRQRQRRIPLDDRLGRGAILKCPDDHFQQDARVPHAQSTVGVFVKRRRLWLDRKTHPSAPARACDCYVLVDPVGQADTILP
jgi:hypothetical protein